MEAKCGKAILDNSLFDISGLSPALPPGWYGPCFYAHAFQFMCSDPGRQWTSKIVESGESLNLVDRGGILR